MAGYLAGDVDEWIYIDIDDQHPNSMRFIRDCEAAVGKEIRILRSKEYKCVEDCVRVYGGFKDAKYKHSSRTDRVTPVCVSEVERWEAFFMAERQ